VSEPRVGIQAGALAGLAGLAVFLVVHHLVIVPIWGIAPVGAVMAIAGGAAVGAAYEELRPRLPGGPANVAAVLAGIAVVLAPSMVIGQLSGPIYSMSAGGGRLLVPAGDAVIAFVGGLLLATGFTAGLLGALVGRTRRATARTAMAGVAVAIGPGHNIPFLGGTTAVATELAILLGVAAAASVTLVAAHAVLARSATADRASTLAVPGPGAASPASPPGRSTSS
jgi:hypothetical protein